MLSCPSVPQKIKKEKNKMAAAATPVYHEVVPATAVSHCLVADFTGPGAQDLVLVRGNRLQYFDLVEDDASGASQRRRLRLRGSHALQGHITGLRSIKKPARPDADDSMADARSGTDALLLSFKDAKVTHRVRP